MVIILRGNIGYLESPGFVNEQEDSLKKGSQLDSSGSVLKVAAERQRVVLDINKPMQEQI